MTDKPAARGARSPLGLDKIGPGPGAPVKPKEPLRPQRPVHQAASDAARQHRPSGLGLDSGAVRARLVQRLGAAQHLHEAVAEALLAVARHHFVDSALATQAYEDTSLPIGLGLNFLVNGRDYAVPMVVEEPSIIAAVSGIAKLLAGVLCEPREQFAFEVRISGLWRGMLVVPDGELLGRQRIEVLLDHRRREAELEMLVEEGVEGGARDGVVIVREVLAAQEEDVVLFAKGFV